MLKRFPAIPIVKGRLRGTRWLPASGGKLLRVMLGTYEKEQTALFERLIHPGDVIFDVGANVGYYTMLAAALVGPRGRVFAFEPEPFNFEFLSRHVKLNGATNVTVVEAAVGDREGDALFEYGKGSGTGHLASGAELLSNSTVEPGSEHLRVSMLTLDEFARANGSRCQAIKIDVEGGEMSVLRGAQALLRNAKPVIFLSTHSAELHVECLQFLRGFRYTFEPIIGDDVQTATEVLCRVPG